MDRPICARSLPRLALRLAPCFFLLCFTAPPAAPAADFVRGQVNGDSAVDISDAVLILDHLFVGGAPIACLEAGDIDDDGALTITDPIVLLSFLFLGGGTIPPPYPSPGPDPTPDGLGCGEETLTDFGAFPSPLILPIVGATAQLAVAGKLGGAPADLHAAASGTTYASSRPEIAGVYRDGLVEARAPGTTVITALNRGQAAEVNLVVSAEGGSPQVRVLAVNDLGMHCMDREYSVFSILPPYNVVHAQVTRADGTGRVALLGGAQVEVRYSSIPDGRGSVNSRSVGKTEFWTYARALFGVQLPAGQGFFGLYLPDDAPAAGPQPIAQDPLGWFRAPGIPITPVDDSGAMNPYPLLRVSAFDRASGAPLGHVDVVVPVSTEVSCAGCHTSGGIAALPGILPWSSDPDLERQAKRNVLILHDDRAGTALTSATPVLCAGCHYSPALDLAGAGPSEEQRKHSLLSHSMHAFHGGLIGESGEPVFPPLGSADATCYQCHPGRTTHCLRGAMKTGGIECRGCHGDLNAVGGVTPLLPGGSLDGMNDGEARRPWKDLPRCGSCHTGDALERLTDADLVPAADGIRLLQAYRTGDESASPVRPTNRRFSENEGTLYRFSTGHGGLLCENCHGSTHAEWPNDDPSHNDNAAAVRIQGHAGALIECASCHGEGTLPLTVGGPHGLHNVNDPRWVSERHGNFYRSNPSSCQACHGLNLQGTALSRAAADRSFVLEDYQVRSFTKGAFIGCYDCHRFPPE